MSLFNCSAAAMYIAVGNVSFDDCDMFTSSFGWIGFLLPMTPPAISIARLEITSLAFMLVCVPLPVCQTRKRKVIVELSFDHFVASLHDQLCLIVREFAQVFVHECRGLLENAKRANHLAWHSIVADVEVMQRPFSLGAPVAIGGYLDWTHRVGFYSWFLRIVQGIVEPSSKDLAIKKHKKHNLHR